MAAWETDELFDMCIPYFMILQCFHAQNIILRDGYKDNLIFSVSVKQYMKHDEIHIPGYDIFIKDGTTGIGGSVCIDVKRQCRSTELFADEKYCIVFIHTPGILWLILPHFCCSSILIFPGDNWRPVIKTWSGSHRGHPEWHWVHNVTVQWHASCTP